jgi:hypothetical protein
VQLDAWLMHVLIASIAIEVMSKCVSKDQLLLMMESNNMEELLEIRKLRHMEDILDLLLFMKNL